MPMHDVLTLTRRLELPKVSGRSGPVALLGYSVETMDAASRLGLDFVAVVPPGFDAILEKDRVPNVAWDFHRRNEESSQLYEMLKDRGVRWTVPLYEETVEWAGGLNSRFAEAPQIFTHSLLFRDKAMMKRRAQMSGIRVGVFEEADSRVAVQRFFRRVNEALVTLEPGEVAPVHLKPVSAAGSVGHRLIRSDEDIATIGDDAFPCLVESHLRGQEFSCEAFIHDGRIRFLNINEYIHLGHSQITPAGPSLEKSRTKIHDEVQKLARTFEVRNGLIHPEYFLDQEGELNFGEVANRVPGGHIFELIQAAYGFDPYAALLLCSDPESTEEELDQLFPSVDEAPRGHAANLMVYPRKRRVTELRVPEEVTADPYFVKHDLVEPMISKVPDREGYGNHYGQILFFGPDPLRLREILLKYEKLEYYV